MSSDRRHEDGLASCLLDRRRFLGASAGALGALAASSGATASADGYGGSVGAAAEIDGPSEWLMDGFDLPGTRHPTDALAVTAAPSEVWGFDVSTDHESGERYKNGTIQYAPATIANDTVIFGDGALTTDRNYVHAVDVETGEHVWRKGMPEVNAAVGVGDGRVYAAGNASHVVGLDLATGEELWKFGTAGRVKSSPKYHDGSVYVGCNDGRFYAVDPEKGFRQWAHDTSDDAEGLRIYGAQPIHGETVYVNTWGQQDQASYVYGLDVDNGRVEWKHELAAEGGKGASPPAVGEDYVFVPNGANERLLAFDVDSHELEWEKSGFEFGPRTAPAVAGCRVVVGSLGGNVTAVNVDSGEWAWRSDTRGAVEVPPVVANGTAYVVDAEGWLYGFALRGGGKRFEYELGRGASTTPRVVDGDLFVASDREMYRFTGDRTDHRDVLPSICGTTTDGDGTTDEGSTDDGSDSGDDSTTSGDDGGGDGDGSDGEDGSDGSDGDAEEDSGSTPGFGLLATAAGLAASGGALLSRTHTDEAD